jgi:hypothetical protein
VKKVTINYLNYFAIATFLLLLTGCGSQGQPEGDLTLLNEQSEEVTLTNKERATVLFHFTEVG